MLPLDNARHGWQESGAADGAQHWEAQGQLLWALAGDLCLRASVLRPEYSCASSCLAESDLDATIAHYAGGRILDGTTCPGKESAFEAHATNEH
mmetsp:Transcript_42613/g.76389  ORF Transcript_42613/g.76389 Transcript_42613/m.76389 type:complete len:94 (-) Transcript_42613:89-370(-)